MKRNERRSSRKPRTKAAPETGRRDPNRWEREAFPGAIERQAALAEPAAVALSWPDGGLIIDAPHSNGGGHTALLSCALGSRSEGWVHKTVTDLMTASGISGKPDDSAGSEKVLNAALAFMSDVAPENTVEAALAVNAYAAHQLSLAMMQSCRQSKMLPQMVAYGNLASKFSARFTQGIEALAKLRRGGEQIVKHVHVHEGGQAVVAGTIHQHKGGGGEAKHDGQSDATNAIAGSAALPGPDPSRDGMPLPLDAERPLQDARRDESGGAQGQ